MDVRRAGIGVATVMISAIILGSSVSADVPRDDPTVTSDAARDVPMVSALQSAPAGSGLRVAYGGSDGRGCRSLVVWRGGQRVKVIASHRAGCSSANRSISMFGRLYFEWFVERRLDGGGWTRRTDLWVTDGTRRGTLRLVTLRSGRGAGRDSCDSRWARAGGNAIAAAQWCWDPRRRTWESGQVRIIIGDEVVRTLPIPRPWHFRMAGRRIVTTGADGRGRELWVHDGVMRRVDIRPGWRGSRPRSFEDLGDRIRFTANDGTGRAVWITDGTVEGTYKLRG